MWADRAVLVTGASGIVGSWLVKELLASSASVVALVRDEAPESELVRSGDMRRTTLVRGSLEDARLLQRSLVEHNVGVVFHLGAQTQVLAADRDPFGTLETNVRGTYNVLEAVRTAAPEVVLVVASSDKAYGETDRLPYTESHPLTGRGVYDASKSAADLIAGAYSRTYGLNVVIARCGNIYGGGDMNWDRIVPGTIRSLLRGDRPVLRSDGTPRRDYLFVRDAVGADMTLAEAAIARPLRGEAFNFGNQVPVSVRQIVAELQEIVGRRDLEPVILDEVRMEIADQYLDSGKAATQLGWQPRFSLRDGLLETVAWYRTILA
jgi:CDP-glucose 4,6-dehydratase